MTDDGMSLKTGRSSWMDAVIPYILRGGVFLAAALAGLGGVLMLARHGLQKMDFSVFHGEASELISIGGIFKASAGLSGEGLIMLGVLCLIATPIARVIFSLLVYVSQKDRIYSVVTSIVLLVLLSSLFSGYIR